MKAFALIAALAFVCPALAQERPMPSIHYSPAENLEHIDLGLIGGATQSIDFAAYVMTDVPVIEALIAAGQRGVTVRIYRDGGSGSSPKGRPGEALLRLLTTPNVTMIFKAPGPLMHLKGYAVDGRILRTGSANFSPSGLKRQDNDLIVIADPDEIRAFESAFEAMWRR